jgi:hypothetical protein
MAMLAYVALQPNGGTRERLEDLKVVTECLPVVVGEGVIEDSWPLLLLR